LHLFLFKLNNKHIISPAVFEKYKKKLPKGNALW